jgi:hypothetical protein
VALGQIFSEFFGFSCQFALHRFLHSHHHLSSGPGTIGQRVAAVPSGLRFTPWVGRGKRDCLIEICTDAGLAFDSCFDPTLVPGSTNVPVPGSLKWWLKCYIGHFELYRKFFFVKKNNCSPHAGDAVRKPTASIERCVYQIEAKSKSGGHTLTEKYEVKGNMEIISWSARRELMVLSV